DSPGVARAAPRARRVRHRGPSRGARRAARRGPVLMSAGVLAAGARPAPRARSLPLRPAEGWLTLFATALMVMVLGGSLQDAAWTPDSTNPAVNFLPWVGLVGVLWGVLGAKVGWGRWRTHVIGA